MKCLYPRTDIQKCDERAGSHSDLDAQSAFPAAMNAEMADPLRNTILFVCSASSSAERIPCIKGYGILMISDPLLKPSRSRPLTIWVRGKSEFNPIPRRGDLREPKVSSFQSSLVVYQTDSPIMYAGLFSPRQSLHRGIGVLSCAPTNPPDIPGSGSAGLDAQA